MTHGFITADQAILRKLQESSGIPPEDGFPLALRQF